MSVFWRNSVQDGILGGCWHTVRILRQLTAVSGPAQSERSTWHVAPVHALSETHELVRPTMIWRRLVPSPGSEEARRRLEKEKKLDTPRTTPHGPRVFLLVTMMAWHGRRLGRLTRGDTERRSPVSANLRRGVSICRGCRRATDSRVRMDTHSPYRPVVLPVGPGQSP